MIKEQIDDLDSLAAGLREIIARSAEVEALDELEQRTAKARAESDEANRQLAQDKAALAEIQFELVRLQVEHSRLSEQIGAMSQAKGDMRAMVNQILAIDRARQSSAVIGR